MRTYPLKKETNKIKYCTRHSLNTCYLKEKICSEFPLIEKYAANVNGTRWLQLRSYWTPCWKVFLYLQIILQACHLSFSFFPNEELHSLCQFVWIYYAPKRPQESKNFHGFAEKLLSRSRTRQAKHHNC